MNDNNPMRDDAVDIVARMVANNKYMEVFHIDGFGLNLENSKVFFDNMKKNSTIINISLNNHPEISVKKYLGLLKSCSNIKVLSIINRNSKNKRSSNEISEIEQYMKENPNVELYY